MQDIYNNYIHIPVLPSLRPDFQYPNLHFGKYPKVTFYSNFTYTRL